MTPKETVVLARYVKACCPGSQIDEYTPDAWHDLLGDLPLAACREAVVAVARRQPFVSASEIRGEVLRVRAERLKDTPVPAPPPELLDDPEAYKAYLRQSAKRIADGKPELRAIGDAS
jgi:hypothetical protein